MRLSAIKLVNFRCFKNESIEISPYTAFIGPNNVGKSTVLKAIDLFFRTNQKSSPLSLSDFNNPENELRLDLTFADLNEEAAKEFSHYYRHNHLEFFIIARAGQDGTAQSSVHGERLGMKEFGVFHVAAKAPEKKKAYNELRETFDLPNIPNASAADVFASALNKFEEDNLDKCVLLASDDLAFGATGVASKLRKFVDWVYIPAVKDAAEENEEGKNSLGILVNRIIRARSALMRRLPRSERVLTIR